MHTAKSKKRRILITSLIALSVCLVIIIAVIAATAKTAERVATSVPESTPITFSDMGILVEYSVQSAWYSNGEDKASGIEATIYNDGTGEIRNVPVVVRENQEIPVVSFTIDSDVVAYLQKEIRESDFIHLQQDLSTDSCDGAYVHIAVHTQKITYICGGLNPNDPQFNRVDEAIWDVIPESAIDEYDAKEEAYFADLSEETESVDQN